MATKHDTAPSPDSYLIPALLIVLLAALAIIGRKWHSRIPTVGLALLAIVQPFVPSLIPWWVIVISAAILAGWFLYSDHQRETNAQAAESERDAKIDTLLADVIERQAAIQQVGAKQDARLLAAEILRFLAQRENDRPTAEQALKIAADKGVWQRVFFGNAAQHIINSMNEYNFRFRGRVDAIVGKLGGDSEIDRLNTPPKPAWPTDIRTISERLNKLADR